MNYLAMAVFSIFPAIALAQQVPPTAVKAPRTTSFEKSAFGKPSSFERERRKPGEVTFSSTPGDAQRVTQQFSNGGFTQPFSGARVESSDR